MIYQLKITLKGSKPPIWRRVQVHSDITFAKLHEIIQACFEWDDYHLHEFRIKSKAYLNHPVVTIGPAYYGYEHEFVDNDFDEAEEILEDHFIGEKSRCHYTYDFGDDWQHEILLEKILPEEEGVHYPRCLKVRRQAPKEDSRWEWENRETAEEVDEKELLDIINERLLDIDEYDERFDPTELETMELNIDRKKWGRLFELISEYQNLEPWIYLADDQLIALKLADVEDWFYCSVLGFSDIQYGLSVFIGNDGLKSLREIFGEPIEYNEYHEFELLTIQRSLHLSFGSRKDLENKDLAIIQSLGLEIHGKHGWPLLRSLKPGYHPWFLNDDEVTLFIQILEGLIPILQKIENKYIPEFSETGQMFALIGEKKEGQVVWQEKTIKPKLEKPNKVDLYLSEFQIALLKKKYKQRIFSIDFVAFYAPLPIQDENDERPYFPTIALFLDHNERHIVHFELLQLEQREAKLQASFVDFIKKVGAVPNIVYFENEDILSIMKPLLETLGINYQFMEENPEITELKKMMVLEIRNKNDFFDE